MATLLKLDRSDTATKGLIRALLNDTNLKSYKLYKPSELQQLDLNELSDGNVSISLLIGQRPYSVKREELQINGVMQTAETIDQISDTLSALFLETTTGGAAASSGRGITVTAGVVDLGRPGTAFATDAELNTTGAGKLFINPNADGAILDFDQVNRNTYINGGRGNTGINSCFLGLGSARNNTGNNVSAFGYRALNGNNKSAASAFGNAAGDTQSGSNVSLFGTLSGDHNTGNNLNAFGYTAGANNTGTQVVAIGNAAGSANTKSRVILIGDAATATADDQLVLSFFRQARFNFSPLSAARDYTMQDVDGTIALLKDGNGITASATAFDLGGILIQATTVSLTSFDLSFQGNGCGVKCEPGSLLTSLGDVGGSGSGSVIGVDDNTQKLFVSANLVTAPGAVAITADFLKILVAGVDYYIPLYQ